MGPVLQIRAGLIVFLAYSCLWQGAEALKCPTAWAHIGKYCYLYVDRELSWAEAEKDCRTFGHLASIHSRKEMKSLARSILKYYKHRGPIWIGLRTIDTGWTRRWRWTDGSGTNFLPWNVNEPNNLFFNEQCVELHTPDLQYWNDTNCERRNTYVCKKLAN